jgi:hypothetical protein
MGTPFYCGKKKESTRLRKRRRTSVACRREMYVIWDMGNYMYRGFTRLGKGAADLPIT